MAKNVTLGGDGRLMVGEDKDVVLEVLDRDGVPVDASGWATTLLITRGETTYITETGTVSGSYSATRASNTQRITFALEDTDMDALTAGNYEWSAKRTTAGSETVLAYGTCLVEQANQ